MRPLQLTRCVIDTAVLTLAAPGELSAGTILARDTVTAKLVLYVKRGFSSGNGTAKAVLAHAVSAAAAGDQHVRVIFGGVVDERQLVVAAGEDRVVDWTVTDQLRRYSITPSRPDYSC